jgi:hypothetical protein
LREILAVIIASVVPLAVLTIIITGAAFSLVAWQPPILQTTQFGTANSENGISAISSNSMGIYAAGFVGYSNVTPTYMFLNKYGFDGRQAWTQHFGQPYLSDILDVAAGSDGVYAAGYLASSSTNKSSFVTKFDFNGNQLWTSQFFQNSLSAAMSVSASSTGVYVGGYNGSQYFVKDYYLNGSLAWTRLFGNNNFRLSVLDELTGVYLVSADTVFSGLVQEYDSTWALSWTHTCSCLPMGITSDGTDVYVFGTNQIAFGNPPVAFLTKYNPAGSMLWTKELDQPGGPTISTGVNEVRASADSSGIYLTETTGDGRGTVMKYDASGNHVWSLQLPRGSGKGFLTKADVIAVQQESIYVGGDLSTNVPTGVSDTAFIAGISESSSLVLFGINPPFSFLLVGLMVAAAAVSIFWLRRSWKKIRGPLSASSVYRSHDIPTDITR